jgi:membrane-associated protein
MQREQRAAAFPLGVCCAPLVAALPFSSLTRGIAVDAIRQLLHTLTDVEGMIRWGGYVALAAIIFSETGLMVGFFLPGDSLLVTAGLFAGRGVLNLFVLWVLLIPCAIAGNTTGYAIGHRIGRALFQRKSSRLFNRRHLVRTQLFYEEHGGKAVVIAQFLPIFRTFTPVVAGVARMRYRRFIAFNVFGAIFWIGSMTSIGYFLVRIFPGIQKHIELMIIAVVLVSFIPGGISSWRARTAARRAKAAFLATMGELATALGQLRWDWSPEALPRLVGSLPSPRERGVVASEAGTPTVSGRRVDVVAAESAPIGTLSEAGEEVAAWEIEARFDQALAVLTRPLGSPTKADPLPDDPAHEGRQAAWDLPGARLTLLHRRDERHRLALRIEPPTGEVTMPMPRQPGG